MKHTRVLAWVNRIRKQYLEKEPLVKLPKGDQLSPDSCVLHNAFTKSGSMNVLVEVTPNTNALKDNWNDGFKSGKLMSLTDYDNRVTLVIDTPSGRKVVPVPLYVERFVAQFDMGKYPELERN